MDGSGDSFDIAGGNEDVGHGIEKGRQEVEAALRVEKPGLGKGVNSTGEISVRGPMNNGPPLRTNTIELHATLVSEGTKD